MDLKAIEPPDQKCSPTIYMLHCTDCKEQFSNLSDLNEHRLVHSSLNLLRCEICWVKFEDASSLGEHMLSHYKSGDYFQCHLCSENFTDVDALKIHQTTQSCADKMGSIKEELNDDSVIDQTGVIKMECDDDGMFAQDSNHEQRKNPFKCKLCGAELENYQSLRRHHSMHARSSRYTCDLCQKSFRDNGNLKRHLLQRHTDKPYACDMCNRSYMNPDLLTKHKLDKHRQKKVRIRKKPIRKKPRLREHKHYFKCNICAEKFGDADIFNDHLNTHDVTNETSNSKGVLNGAKKDQKVESTDTACADTARQSFNKTKSNKPCQCPICHVNFKDKRNRDRHMFLHSATYTCEICKKSFRDSGNLKRHQMIVHTSARQFKCDQCDKKYKDPSNLLKHKKLNKCNEYQNPQKSSSELLQEMLQDIPGSHYRCHLCKEYFLDSDTLKNHILKSHSEENTLNERDSPSGEGKLKQDTSTPISVEDTATTTLASPKYMSRTECDNVVMPIPYRIPQPSGKPFQCTVCSAELKTKDGLVRHMNTHTKRYSCDLCQKSFRDTCNMKRHILQVHTDYKPFVCDICQKEYKDPSSLTRHKLTKHGGQGMLSHIPGTQYKCHICPQKFTDANTLKAHLDCHEVSKETYTLGVPVHNMLKQNPNAKTPNIDKKATVLEPADGSVLEHTGLETETKDQFKCPVCGVDFKDKRCLNRHMPTHTKRFACDICSKTFRDGGNLTRHIMQTHTDNRAYSCEICSKTYKDQSALAKHTRNIHSAEGSKPPEPQPCPICKKLFGSKYLVNRHVKSFHNKETHECDICNKKFIDLCGMKRHRENTHFYADKDREPFTCKVCFKVFKISYNLKRHMSVHTGDKKFGCDMCSKYYFDQADLKKHLIGVKHRKKLGLYNSLDQSGIGQSEEKMGQNAQAGELRMIDEYNPVGDVEMDDESSVEDGEKSPILTDVLIKTEPVEYNDMMEAQNEHITTNTLGFDNQTC